VIIYIWGFKRCYSWETTGGKCSVERQSWKMRKRTVKCKMIEKLREVEKSKKSQEKLEKNERN
jgi:hypothetical protein